MGFSTETWIYVLGDESSLYLTVSLVTQERESNFNSFLNTELFFKVSRKSEYFRLPANQNETIISE